MAPHSTREFQDSRGPLLGRVVLLLAAYTPVAVIAGLRGLPATVAWVSVALGLFGIAVWLLFLWWLPERQRRTSIVKDPHFIDSEVNAYIVSILLPVVAAANPALTDWLAYGVCAVLILLVAFAAELWAVNPITYAFGLRAARAVIDGERRVVLVRGSLGPEGKREVVRRIGVTLLFKDESQELADEAEELTGQ
jgi:hypothetical protein